MDSALDLLSPYNQSFAFDDTEQALKNLFIDVFTELFKDQIGDIHHYGMPHFGSPKVVERFTKQDGLVVLRRQQSSDLIMRVIYANWRSMASRRGLSFLEFVLQMIWSDQWEIKRMYHSIERGDLYPTLGTTFETVDSFLTSRIMIVLQQGINADEVSNLSPIISKLVPANIVANVSLNSELENMDEIKVAAALMPYMIGNFQFFEEVSGLRIAWTEWSVRSTYSITVDTVRYNGSKTDLFSVYSGYADYNLRALALSVMSDAAYNTHDGIWHSILALKPLAVSYEVNTASSLLNVSILPASLNDNSAAAVMKNRITLSSNGNYLGKQYMSTLLSYLGWSFITGNFYYSVPADEIKRLRYIYKVGTISSYIDATDAAQRHIDYELANNPQWLEYTLTSLENISDSGQSSTFVQHYTVPPPPPQVTEPLPFNAYVIDPSVTVSGVMANYTGYKTNGTDFYDSYAALDLTEAVNRSMLDFDMQVSQAVQDAVSELTSLSTGYIFDNENQRISFADPTQTYKDNKYLFLSDQVDGEDQANWVHDPMVAVQMSLDYFNSLDPDTVYSFVKWDITDDQWIDDHNQVISWTMNAYYSELDYSSESTGQMIYAKDDPDYNPEALLPQAYVSFSQIAAKIVSNAIDENARAESFIEAIADSIFDADAVKQFVTLADLSVQLEANQVLRDRAPDPDPLPVPMQYQFVVNRVANPAFVGENATDNVLLSNAAVAAMFTTARTKATNEGNTAMLLALNNAVKAAYAKDPTYTTTNSLYVASLVNVTFAAAVNQIFVTMQNTQSPHYPSAKLYLSKIVETIFLTTASKQLIKLANLKAGFEATKVLKTVS